MSVRYRRDSPLPNQTKKVEDEDKVEEWCDNTEIVRVPLDGVIADLIERLRSGEDVRFTLDGKEVLRVHPCLDADCETMYPSAHAMGELRDCLADIEFEMVDKDKSPVEPVRPNISQGVVRARNVTYTLTETCGEKLTRLWSRPQMGQGRSIH